MIWTVERRRVVIRSSVAASLGVVLCAAQILLAQSPGARGGATGGPPDNSWMQAPPTSTGIAVGQKIPAFSLTDQNGKMQTFSSIKGPNGAAIYFMRSADW